VILDLGCGTSKRRGAIGVDYSPLPGVDVVHDLNDVPYPFASSTADEIYMDNVLEHLEDVVATVDELHRIAKGGALVTVYVPYFRSGWAAVDPTHRHQFTVDSFGYFDPSHPFFDRYRYSTARLRLEAVRFNERWPARGWRARVARIANRNPQRYEARFSQFFPLGELTFRLRVIKDEASSPTGR